MLTVPYSADIPPALRDLVEHHARRLGVSLEVLDVAGTSLDVAEAFIVAAEDNRMSEFLVQVGLIPPAEDTVARARWVAQRLFG